MSIALDTSMPELDREQALENPGPRTAANLAQGADPIIVEELVTLLATHPGGLRRWSVMQAIRRSRNRTTRPVSLRFETEIERVFRTLSAEGTEPRERDESPFLFYRPEGKAGEVWAVRPERAQAWRANPQNSGQRAPKDSQVRNIP